MKKLIFTLFLILTLLHSSTLLFKPLTDSNRQLYTINQTLLDTLATTPYFDIEVEQGMPLEFHINAYQKNANGSIYLRAKTLDENAEASLTILHKRVMASIVMEHQKYTLTPDKYNLYSIKKTDKTNAQNVCMSDMSKLKIKKTKHKYFKPSVAALEETTIC